jgi:hypothetical protein
MRMTWGFVNKPAAREEVLAQVGPGWRDILTRLLKDLELLNWDGTIFQVKEKFGGLRFYIGGGNDAIFMRIKQAEAESYRFCEYCGEPGKLYRSGWWRTLCMVHAKEQNRKEADDAE